jgi:hypothetical protein
MSRLATCLPYRSISNFLNLKKKSYASIKCITDGAPALYAV